MSKREAESNGGDAKRAAAGAAGAGAGAGADADGDGKRRWLVFGKTGWIGAKLLQLLRDAGEDVVAAQSRLENRDAVAAELDSVKPTHVLNAAGLTGRPNVDWCEDHKEEVIRVNVVGTLSLADLTAARNVHCTMLATGCIYAYDDAHALGSGVGFTEDDPPNFTGSFYSATKGVVDGLLKVYAANVLVLRLRMPLTDEYEHPRSFITKITHYRKVVNVPNSMTNLDEMLPIAIDMARRRRTGPYNFTNPGVVSHNEVLALYKRHVHADFEWQNFTLEEQAKVLKADRSNNELDVSKLRAEYPALMDIHTSLDALFRRMAANKPADAKTPVPSR